MKENDLRFAKLLVLVNCTVPAMLLATASVAGTDTGFAVDTNAVTMIDRAGGKVVVPVMAKDAVADRILDRVIALRQRGVRRSAQRGSPKQMAR